MNEVEVLMAAYNSSKYLDEQLQSLFAQTYTDFTLTVRDNASTDTTLQILEKWQQRYPNRIRLHKAKQHTDALGNFSAVSALSQGDYCAFSDSDDVWLPNKLALSMQQLKQLEARHGKDTPSLIYTDLIPTDEHLKPLAASFWKESGFAPTPPHFTNQLMRNRITGCTLVCNRALINLAGPIPQEAIMHDAWLGLVATAFGRVASLQESTLLYRQHANNELGIVPASPLKLLSYGKLLAVLRRSRQPHKRFSQARVFLQRYRDLLSEQQRQTLEAFLLLPQSSLLSAVRLMQKHKFYEPTWAWTLYSALFRKN